jgi:hypothetical protein
MFLLAEKLVTWLLKYYCIAASCVAVFAKRSEWEFVFESNNADKVSINGLFPVQRIFGTLMILIS